jgi:hypothetical protein
MDTNRNAHLEQLNHDIQRWLLEADRLEEGGQKSRAEIIRGWAKNARRLCERIRDLN